jgi:hypothetical protein
MQGRSSLKIEVLPGKRDGGNKEAQALGEMKSKAKGVEAEGMVM